MFKEQERRESQSDYEIEIIGSGNTGEKAKQLIAKAEKLIGIGFAIPKTTVLAEDFFNGFFQTNKFGSSLSETPEDPNLVEIIKDGSFSSEDFKKIKEISSRFPASPLVVRSSAEGDARGTGIYKSIFTENTQENLGEAIKEVLAGYFTEDAIAFRKDAKTGKGFGIIIQPLIYQEKLCDYEEGMTSNDLAPVLSGFGYTSTSKGEGYLNIVPGIGGGVETRDGEQVTKTSIAKYEGSIASYAVYEKSKMFQEDSIPVKRSALLGTTQSIFNSHRHLDANVFTPASKHFAEGVCKGSINLSYESENGELFSDLNLNCFFEMMEKTEISFGKPQYFEWAMTFKNKKPKFWMLQIADIDKKDDMFNFESFGEPLLDAHTVTGSGITECNEVVICPDPWSLKSLYNYNLEHKDYVLLYSSTCTSLPYIGEKLRYAYVSNASVILEIQDARHADNAGYPLNHWAGNMDMAGKLFGVIAKIEDNPFLQEAVGKGKRNDYDVIIYDKKVKVVSSERQNKLTVFEG